MFLISGSRFDFSLRTQRTQVEIFKFHQSVSTVRRRLNIQKFSAMRYPSGNQTFNCHHILYKRYTLCVGRFDSFPWRQHLNINTNHKCQVKTTTDTFLNIMSNFIPNETKIFVPRDPPWITKPLKTMLNRKNRIFNNYKVKWL